MRFCRTNMSLAFRVTPIRQAESGIMLSNLALHICKTASANEKTDSRSTPYGSGVGPTSLLLLKSGQGARTRGLYPRVSPKRLTAFPGGRGGRPFSADRQVQFRRRITERAPRCRGPNASIATPIPGSGCRACADTDAGSRRSGSHMALSMLACAGIARLRTSGDDRLGSQQNRDQVLCLIYVYATNSGA